MKQIHTPPVHLRPPPDALAQTSTLPDISKPAHELNLPDLRHTSYSPSPAQARTPNAGKRIKAWQTMSKRKPSKFGDRATSVTAKPAWRNREREEDSDEEPKEQGGIYPASSEPEWALYESKLKGIFKKSKTSLLKKNGHKAPINRVIETTEDEEFDGYGRTQAIITQEKMVNDARNETNIY